MASTFFPGTTKAQLPHIITQAAILYENQTRGIPLVFHRVWAATKWTPRTGPDNIRRMAHLREVWSVLRDPLLSLSFSQMRRAASAAGLPTVELSNLTQASTGYTSKAVLADALDGLFRGLDGPQQDRVAGHLIVELIGIMPSDATDRLEVLLERVGWHLVAGEPTPLDLRLETPTGTLPATVRDGVAKGLRRYRSGDYDGAITAVAGVIDTLTEQVYTANGLSGHKRASYQQRAVTAHKELEGHFRSTLIGMTQTEADLAWAGQQRAVNGAADVLGAFRRSFSDAHGSGPATPALVQSALQAALFLVDSLSD